jgi:hypothetical protein
MAEADADEHKTTLLSKRRARYHEQRRMLVDMGFMPKRGPGRPRLWSPEEARERIKAQKRESQQRTKVLIQQALARMASEPAPTLVC